MANSWWMLTDSKGNKSVMLTFATVSFFISSLAVLMGIIKVVTIGSVHLEFGSADPTLTLGYLAACFTSYVIRRNNEDKVFIETMKQEDTKTE